MSEFESVSISSNGNEQPKPDLQKISESKVFFFGKLIRKVMVILKEVIHTTTSIPVETAEQIVKSFDEYSQLLATQASKLEGITLYIQIT